MCQQFERLIQPDDDDDRIKNSLNAVWFLVNGALKTDPVLKMRLANQDEFQENVKNKGEEQFINLLKDMAEKKNWRDLLENRTFFLSSDLKRSHRVVSLAVFFEQFPSDESNSHGLRWSEASKNGAQCP